MAPYNNQYSNYYDPVGSQSNQQPTGYTYQQPTGGSTSQYPSATASNNYQNSSYDYGTNAYGSNTSQQQQYGQTAPQSTNRAAAAVLSSLSASDYTPSSSAAPASSTYNTTSWGTANYPASYQTNRAQSNNSPLPAAQSSASTFGRLSGQDQTSSTSGTYGQHAYQSSRASANTSSSQSYSNTHTQQHQQQQVSQRYASPLHAVQAQQNSRSSTSQRQQHQPSPQLAAQHLQAQHNRQASASVEPSPTTVNPSQVYDDRAERQRQARIEAEKKKKREEQEAVRKAQEDAKKAEEEARQAAEEARKAEEERKEAEKRKVAEEEAERLKAEKEAAKKKAESERRKKVREEKKQSKSAATVLQNMASSGPAVAPAGDGPPLNDEEVEMRAMFQKMREFNAKNPAMLAKLWEEERKTHASQSPQPANAAPTAPAPTPSTAAAAPPAKKQLKKSGGVVSPGLSKQGYTPTQKPPTPVAPPKAPVPTSNSSTTSLWPPHKKGSLAEAAATWLAHLPENSGRHITRADVLAILERNPSYVQLCEALEALHLRFERSLLARELLKAVPDGLKGPAGAAPAKPLVVGAGRTPGQADGGSKIAPRKRGRKPKDTSRPSSATVNGTVDYEAPSFTPLTDVAREVNSMGQMQPPRPSMPSNSAQLQQSSPWQINGPWAAPAMASSSRAPSQSQAPEVKPEVVEGPPKPPKDKEDAARKRDFGDLVDLTAEMSDEEPPPKKMFMGVGQGNGMPQMHSQPGPSFTNPISAREFYKPGKPQVGNLAQGMHNAIMPNPAQMPLNGVPTPPPALAPRPKGPNQEHLQQERIKGKMLVEPIMRDRVARKSRYDPRTIARDVLLATGRHPDMRGLNAHLQAMSRLLAERGGSYEGTANKSDLATIRWELIDPNVPKVDSNAESKKPATADVAPMPAAVDGYETDDADDEDNGGPVRQQQHQMVNNGDGTVSYVSVYAPTGKPGMPIKKRRGRPPRSSMPGATNLAGGDRQQNTPARQVPAAGGTTPQSAPAGQPIGYSAFRQFDADGNVIKRKGRPVGWRKTIHSREAAGLAPKQNSHKRKSGASGDVGGSGEKAEAEPKYQIYKCQWRDCRAELHNLDTLKKHVLKIHGRPDDVSGRYECLWISCETIATHEGKGKGKAVEAPPPLQFDLIHEWMNHINSAHFQPVAWSLGDGPRTDYATDSETYLSDAQGRSVTPVIRPRMEATSRVVPDVVEGKEEKKAREELRGLEVQKRKVGVVMEKSGSSLVNAKRRGGFLDDEEFEDEVQSEGVEPPSGGEEDDDDDDK